MLNWEYAMDKSIGSNSNSVIELQIDQAEEAGDYGAMLNQIYTDEKTQENYLTKLIEAIQEFDTDMEKDVEGNDNGNENTFVQDFNNKYSQYGVTMSWNGNGDDDTDYSIKITMPDKSTQTYTGSAIQQGNISSSLTSTINNSYKITQEAFTNLETGAQSILSGNQSAINATSQSNANTLKTGGTLANGFNFTTTLLTQAY
jgi:hypothetical protein